MEGVAAKKALVDRYNEIGANYSGETADEMGKLQDAIEAQGLWDLDSQVDQAMDALRCPEGDAEVSTLSGGERRRVALCKLLLDAPDILLLDEPTNHLDAESVEWLHQEGAEEADRERTIAREREWISSSPRARQAKSKARINAYDELLAKSQEQRGGTAQIVIPVAERLGSVVVEAEELAKGYGDRLLYENVSFTLPPGGIVGVIGPNGAGKTTLFRMLTGQEKADAGELRVGPTVKMGYVDQSRDALDAKKTVWEEIS